MTRKDKDALKRALVMVETVDAEIAQRIKAHSTWQEAAERAAFFCQMRLLHLRPWMTPPMLSHDEIRKVATAAPSKRLACVGACSRST